MAIALRGVSTQITPTTAATTIPAVNGSAVAGDLSILVLTGKPFNTTGMAFSGWVPLTGILTSGSVANGADSGSVFIGAWVKESAATGAVTAPTMTNFNTDQCVIVTFSKAATEVWDYSVWTNGIDSTSGTNYSGTGAAIPTASGDMILAVTGINTDSVTTLPTLTGMAGSTIGTVVTDANWVNATGNQCSIVAVHAPITAGSSAAAPAAGLTNSNATTLGETLFLRLRVGQLVQPSPLWKNQAIPTASIW